LELKLLQEPEELETLLSGQVDVLQAAEVTINRQIK